MKYSFLLISLILTLIVFSMSIESGEVSGSLSFGITNWVYNILGNIIPNNSIYIGDLHIFIRKSAHIFEYMVLAISWFYTMKSWNWVFFNILLIGLIIASVDETIQIFSPGRGPSIVDALMFDYLSFCITSIIALLIYNKEREKKMISNTLLRLQDNNITPKLAYDELFKNEKKKKISVFKYAHFIKLSINIPGEKGVNRFLKILFFLPISILFLKFILVFIKLDKFDDDIPLTKKEIIRLIAHKGVRIKVNAKSGEKILIKTI